MFEITQKGRAFIDAQRPSAGYAAWVRADAIENYQRFQQHHCRQAASPPA